MQLTVGQIHDIFLALTAMDRDESIKLSGDIRFKVARNWNVIRPLAEAYERARFRVLADINAADRAAPAKRSEAELQADFAEADLELRSATEDLALKSFSRNDLKLDDNQKISGLMLARLAPVLEISDS